MTVMLVLAFGLPIVVAVGAYLTTRSVVTDTERAKTRVKKLRSDLSDSINKLQSARQEAVAEEYLAEQVRDYLESAVSRTSTLSEKLSSVVMPSGSAFFEPMLRTTGSVVSSVEDTFDSWFANLTRRDHPTILERLHRARAKAHVDAAAGQVLVLNSQGNPVVVSDDARFINHLAMALRSQSVNVPIAEYHPIKAKRRAPIAKSA